MKKQEMKKQEWPKYDPRLGAYLCQRCWNAGSWAHHCIDADSLRKNFADIAAGKVRVTE